MELGSYLGALLQRWYVVVALGLVGAFGTYLYFQQNGKTTVSATVAVWEPAVVRGGDSPQAQLSFAPIIQSRTVAQRVVTQLGLPMSPEAVQGEISVKLAKSLVPTLVTPLYVVSVDDRDSRRADQILSAAIEQARQVFAQMNGVTPSQVDAAFAPREAQLQAQLDNAENALDNFEKSNDAYGLPSRIDSQEGLVSSLRGDARSIQSGTRGAALATQKQGLADAQKRLATLRSLQPQYDRLSFNEKLASDAVEQLSARQNAVSAPDAAKARAQVADSKKDLDNALNALAAFQKAHGVGDLSTQIATQTALVNNLLQLKQQITLSQGTTTAQQNQVAAAQLGVDQAKNAVYAADAQRDGVCGNAANPKYQCDAANAQVAAAQTGVQQAELGLKAVSGNPSPGQLTANVDQALASTQAELTKLRGLLPEYERLTLDVGFAQGTVTQTLSQSTGLALQPDPAALKAETAAAQSQLDQARGQLAAFETANRIGDLPSEISAQQTLVSNLQQQVLTTESESAGRPQAIATEQVELNRLTALQPKYNQLSAQVSQIQSQISQLQASKLSLLVNASLIPSAEVKELDSPAVQPNTFWTIVLYALSIAFGLFAGLVVVYLLAYFDQTPRSAADVQTLVGAPVLVRVPNVNSG